MPAGLEGATWDPPRLELSQESYANPRQPVQSRKQCGTKGLFTTRTPANPLAGVANKWAGVANGLAALANLLAETAANP